MIPVLDPLVLTEIVPLLGPGKPISVRRESLKIQLSLPPGSKEILKRCDGKRPFSEVSPDVRKAKSIYNGLSGLNLMFLRAPA